SNQPAGTGPGLNQNLLPPSDRELLADRARRNVERATGRHRQHDLDGLVRIPVLCQRGGGTDRDSSNQGGTQKTRHVVLHRLCACKKIIGGRFASMGWESLAKLRILKTRNA